MLPLGCHKGFFSSCSESGLLSTCSAPASHCGAQSIDVQTSVAAGSGRSSSGFRGSAGSIVGAHGLSRSMAGGVRGHPGSGTELVSPASASGFFTTGPPGPPGFISLSVAVSGML